MKGQARVVGAGIDTLVVGFSVARYVDPEEFEMLAEAKEKAGERLFGGGGSSVTWYGREFSVSPRGAKGYEFVVQNGDVVMCVARETQGGRVYPEVYVTFRAEYLWREGYVRAFNAFCEWLGSWAVVNGDTVSRCDLCVDIQMDVPMLDLAREAVTRARLKTDYFEKCESHVSGGRKTGYRVGSGALVGRIYDKTLEITVSQKQWFRTIWKASGWDGESRVVRVEFQGRRQFLKEMSVDSFSSLCGCLGDIWRYCTCEWLTIRVPCGDSHRNRWAVAEWWQVIQGGVGRFGEPCGVARGRQHEFRYDCLMKQAKGALVSAAAVQSAGLGLAEGCFVAVKDMRDFVTSDGFPDAVRKRSAKVALMSAPRRTHLVDAVVRAGGRIVSVESQNGDEEE